MDFMGPSKVCINLGLFNFLKVIVKFRITKCDLKKKILFLPTTCSLML